MNKVLTRVTDQAVQIDEVIESITLRSLLTSVSR